MAAVQQDHIACMDLKALMVILKKHPAAVYNRKHKIIKPVPVYHIGMVTKIMPYIGCVNQGRARKF